MQVSISSTFYEQLLSQYSFVKKSQSQTTTRKKMCKALLYKKGSSKTLMKLTRKGAAILADDETFLFEDEMAARERDKSLLKRDYYTTSV